MCVYVCVYKDLDLVRFIITCLSTYFPGILAYLLLFEMPWLLSCMFVLCTSCSFTFGFTSLCSSFTFCFTSLLSQRLLQVKLGPWRPRPPKENYWRLLSSGLQTGCPRSCHPTITVKALKATSLYTVPITGVLMMFYNHAWLERTSRQATNCVSNESVYSHTAVSTLLVMR